MSLLRPRLRAMTSDLRNRLLLLLVLPLCVLALLGAWMDYRSADEAASRHDQRLLRLLPALADSVLARGPTRGHPGLAAGPASGRLPAPQQLHQLQRARSRAVCCWAMNGCTAPSRHAGARVPQRGVRWRHLPGGGAAGRTGRENWSWRWPTAPTAPAMGAAPAAAGAAAQPGAGGGGALAIHWAVRRAFKPLVDLARPWSGARRAT